MSSIRLQSIAKGEAPAPWLSRYPEFVPAKLDYPEQPVWWLLEQAAKNYPDRVATHYYEQELTYRELHSAARRTAAMLAERGVQPGMRVGLLLPNIPEYLIAAYGVWMAGGVIVSISPLMCAEEVAGLIKATQCHTVIGLDVLASLALDDSFKPDRLLLTTIQDHLPRWQQVLYAFARLQRNGLRAGITGLGAASFLDEIAHHDDTFQPVRSEADTPAYILPTGGTTGAPKAVVLSHGNLIANAWQLAHWTGNRVGEEKVMAVIPFFHSYGLSSCATWSVATAATLVMFHRFKTEAVLQLIERHRPNGFTAVPAMLSSLCERLRERRYDLSSIEYCISGGAALDLSVAEEFATHTGGFIVEGYGLSESSPVTHTGPLDGTARPGTIGLPLSDTEAVIVDAEEGIHVMPPGEIGELVIRGPQVMLGYWNDEEQTGRTIRDGWLFTGDLAVCDEDGFFRIVDRKKDLIITSGFNVVPADVEHVLRGYPGVRDVAVVGVPDAEKGEIVKAVFVMEKGMTLDRGRLDRFTSEHLSRHKRPKEVEVLSGDLPRNFLGKVLRRELRSQENGQPSSGLGTLGTDVPVVLSGSEAAVDTVLSEAQRDAS